MKSTRYTGTTDIPFSDDFYDFVGNVTYDYYQLPAKLDGAWECCYPEEVEFEYEINYVEFDGTHDDNLSEYEMNSILTQSHMTLDEKQETDDYILDFIKYTM